MRGPVLALQMPADNGSWKAGVGTDIIKKLAIFASEPDLVQGVLAGPAGNDGGFGLA